MQALRGESRRTATSTTSRPTTRRCPRRARRRRPTTEPSPALVRVGDPLRNIAPCVSCHGGIDQKLGAPWLEGMAQKYLVDQLQAFASGARRNDSHAQMRNMVRQMTNDEIAEVSEFYARPEQESGGS